MEVGDQSTIGRVSVLTDLTKNEIEIYKGFLKYGESTAAGISRKLLRDKSSTYRIVENLKYKSLIIEHPRKRGTTYKAVNPDILYQMYKNKLQEYKQQENVLGSFINELKKEQKAIKRSTFITVEKGLEALKSRMEESLSSKEKLIRERFRTDHRFFNDVNHTRWVVGHAKRRVKKGVRIKQLEYEEVGWRKFDDVMYKQKKYLKEIRLLPEGFDDNNSFRIWDETINIVSYGEGDEFLIITIKDKYVARFMKNIFDFIWGKSKKRD